MLGTHRVRDNYLNCWRFNETYQQNIKAITQRKKYSKVLD